MNPEQPKQFEKEQSQKTYTFLFQNLVQNQNNSENLNIPCSEER